MTLTAADVRSTGFAAPSRLRRGYDADAVDAFVERIAVRLETGEGLSSNDVYHVPLAKAGIGSRGYQSAEVDAFLERVHAELVVLEDAWGHESGPPPGPDEATAADSELPADGAPPLPDGEVLAEIAAPTPDDTRSPRSDSADTPDGSAADADDPDDRR